MNALARRLARLEQIYRATHQLPIFRIMGGFHMDDSMDWARLSPGGESFTRNKGETPENFCKRIEKVAIEKGAKCMVISGLPIANRDPDAAISQEGSETPRAQSQRRDEPILDTLRQTHVSEV